LFTNKTPYESMAKLQHQDTTHDFFDFFGLPSELRGAIYEQTMITVGSVKLIQGGMVTAAIRNACSPKLLLVNKRFSEEYKSRSAELITMTAYEHFEEKKHQNVRTLMPVALTECRSVIANCGIAYSAGSELKRHARWITGLVAKLPHLQTFHVNVCKVIRSEDGAKSLALEDLDVLMELPAITSIDILLVRSYHGRRREREHSGQVKAQ
jgi:hypothetical protein